MTSVMGLFHPTLCVTRVVPLPPLKGVIAWDTPDPEDSYQAASGKVSSGFQRSVLVAKSVHSLDESWILGFSFHRFSMNNRKYYFRSIG